MSGFVILARSLYCFIWIITIIVMYSFISFLRFYRRDIYIDPSWY